MAELLEKSGSSGALLLGNEVGSEEDPFDPGRQGAYFQTEAEVKSGALEVRNLMQQQRELDPVLAPVLGMLEQAAKRGRGLYVTF
ncbi:MAG: hypothetical protein QM756_06570 [Polyangiaceae bacterium]